MLNFKNITHNNTTDTGVVIENKDLNPQNKQITIKINNFKYIPNDGTHYLVSFRGVGRSNRQFHTLELQNVPDENNLLTFNFSNSDHLNKDLSLLTPGVRVKVRGPIVNSTKEAC